MVFSFQAVTAQDFEARALHTENSARRLELVGGEVIDVVSSGYALEITARQPTIDGYGCLAGVSRYTHG